MSGPLAGLKVIDLTSVLMGPYCTQLMADMGADVIKVEPPQGDSVRGIGPSKADTMGAIFLQANRGKRSIVLDLKQGEGREILLSLVKTADLFVYTVRPQAMARLALSYEDVAAINPTIIYAGMYGYGQDGPYAHLPAYDDLVQGGVGIPALLETCGAELPLYVPLALADRVVGLHGLGAILAALWQRQRSGIGQRVEVPMFETMAHFVLGDHLGGKLFDPPIGPMGYPRLLSQHRRPYKTKDGHVCAVIYNDGHWKRFFSAIGRPDFMASDPKFASIATRTQHINEIYEMIALEFTRMTTGECIQLLRDADIPVTPLLTVDDLLQDPHLLAKSFFTTLEHPTEGSLRMPGIPMHFSKTAATLEMPAPNLGEHTIQIMSQLGYDKTRIEELVGRGVIGVTSYGAAT